MLANGDSKIVGLPFEAGPRAYVGSCIPARLLLRAAEHGDSYRVIAVSVNRVRVAMGDARGLGEETSPRDVPASLVDALGPELERAGIQFHNVSGTGSQPVYHGHRDAATEREVDRERFHRILADSLVRNFGASDMPIVWVADKAHLPLARELSRRLPIVGTAACRSRPVRAPMSGPASPPVCCCGRPNTAIRTV